MPPSRAYLSSAVLTIPFLAAALAQTTHNVTVGAQGSFYDPPTVSAALNDTVNFIFVGPVHSVVQAAFDSPCFPLPGGFSTGLVKRDDFSPPPIWSLKITNVTTAIWFYCQNTMPVPHCASGMVGAINPPSQAAYQQFLDNAKFVSASPPQVSLALTGQGAFATNPAAVPTAPGPATTAAPSTSTADASNSTSVLTVASTSATPSPTAAAKSMNGTIIGGSVGGGVVGLAILVILAFILFRRCKRRNRRDSKDFFRYNAETPTLGAPKETFFPSKLVSPPSTDRSRTTALPPSSYSSPASQPSTLVPQRPSPTVRTTDLTGGAAASPAKKTPTSPAAARRVPPLVMPTARQPLPPPPVPAPAPPPPPPRPRRWSTRKFRSRRRNVTTVARIYRRSQGRSQQCCRCKVPWGRRRPTQQGIATLAPSIRSIQGRSRLRLQDIGLV
ncbi:hypothetical protein LshimejAT787_1602190 [Lyophyllum shimeji]|uniref:Extracellular serine-rich protein n=1 Tax=Lyophyllum shimeji TaxID=47721 RepID=A0A9P3UQS8_LYOSH|nr:hypothetical protein LshimejAT787_1602190 [Lyophyllum shimeji]